MLDDLDVPTPHRRAPRLTPVTGEVPPLVADALDSTRWEADQPLFNIFTTMAHHGRVLRQSVKLGGAFLFRGTLAPRLREIVILRVARNCRCEYEYAQHVVIGQRSGLSGDECRALLGRDPGESFSTDERTAIAMVDELCADDVVSDTTWAAMAERWSNEELIELVMLAGYYRMIAGFLNSAAVPLDEGLAGWPDA